MFSCVKQTFGSTQRNASDLDGDILKSYVLE